MSLLQILYFLLKLSEHSDFRITKLTFNELKTEKCGGYIPKLDTTIWGRHTLYYKTKGISITTDVFI